MVDLAGLTVLTEAHGNDGLERGERTFSLKSVERIANAIAMEPIALLTPSATSYANSTAALEALRLRAAALALARRQLLRVLWPTCFGSRGTRSPSLAATPQFAAHLHSEAQSKTRRGNGGH